MALSADGKFAVTASGSPPYIQSAKDNTVRLWELPSGKPLGVLTGHNARIRGVAISADGHLIASGSDDGSVILWDMASRSILRTIKSSYGPVQAVSFDAAAHALLVASNRLAVWNLERARRARHALAPSVAAARQSLQSNPQDAAAMLSLGRWYAQQDQAAWASRFLQLARDGHQEIPTLELARCQWERGDLAAAEREMKLTPVKDAPAYYVNLCVAAIRSEAHKRE